MTAPYTSDSYQGIIDAFNTMRASQGEEKRGYDPNYRGIIEAILDLKKWGQAGDGDYPPGWVPEYDEDGNVIGGDWNPSPDNGTLWFDERQGRLFVWIDDDFYQTNGGDGLPHVGSNPPTSEVPGSFWFNINTNVLYIYDGSNWTIVSTGGSGVTTDTLILSNPTTSTFKSGQPILPSSIGLVTQEDYNKWIHQALEELEEQVEEQDGKFQVYMADVPPQQSEEGDLWYNTTKLQMLVRYDGAWVASAIPVVLDEGFVNLTNTVEFNRQAAATGLQGALAQIHELSNRPERLYRIAYDVVEQGIELVDTKGTDKYLIKFEGDEGINVDVTALGIKIDASGLVNDLRQLEQTVASGDNVNAIADRLSVVEGNLSSMLNTTTVSPIAFAALVADVAALPSADDVSGRLSELGGTLQGALTMSNQRILEVGVPVNNTDAARKIDIDNLKDYTDSTFINKAESVISGFKIQKSDVTDPTFDFSHNASTGMQALKLKTYGGSNNHATFGITQNQWEYAWNFGSNEDFCWVHGTNGKQVSINKDGLTARSLTLGTFLPNTESGTMVMNKIDVGESLAKHKEALQTIKAALIVSTSFEEFKLEVLQTLNTI